MHGGFVSLLDDIVAVEGDFRVRLSSMNPGDLTPEFLQFLVDHKKICNHLHVSIQSFSPSVLRRMDRNSHDSDLFTAAVSYLRKKDSAWGIGVDLITGFPGESEDEFNQTYTMVQSLPLLYGHVFRYSLRPGTRSSTMTDHIDEKVKKVRSSLIRDALIKSRRQFINEHIGEKHTIIIENEHPVRGVTSNYIRVEIENARGTKHEWLDVRLTAYDGKRNVVIAQL